MSKRMLAAAILGMASITSAMAAEISIADFTAAQTVVDMSGAGAHSGNFTYSGIGFSNVSSGSGGPGWRDLTMYNYGYTDNAGITDISVDFGSAYAKVGLDLHIAATYMVSFYNGADLLGSISKTLASDVTPVFAGWNSANGITRIRILETSGDNSKVGGFDMVRFESTANAVPEPGSLALLGLGLAGFALSRRRKA